MIVLIISATGEWRCVRDLLPSTALRESPYGEWFMLGGMKVPLVVFNGGWGKIAAAASAQYAIGRWNPSALLNAGTCGGLGKHARPGDIILARRTLVYDMVVEIGDPGEEMAYYTTDISIPDGFASRLPFPVLQGTIVSGDRDVARADVPVLIERYGALAADWESASIAFVARRAGLPCVILRGISDVVGGAHPDAYDGRDHIFHAGARGIMQHVIENLSGIMMAMA